MNDEDLRDLFAGMALHNSILAKTAYYLADAMIKAKYEVTTETTETTEEAGIAAVVTRSRRRNATATKEGI
jgi:non-homologous end joining protein Ku